MLSVRTPLVVASLTLCTAASALAAPPAQAKTAPAPASATVRVEMETSMGTVELELDRKRAPLTVENFIKYAQSGFYNGTGFHRVINNFMIQGGGFDERFNKKPTLAPLRNESTNGLSNTRGSISMARTNDPDSATSQFFINHADNRQLDGSPNRPGYTVFGHVVKGMDVVDRIAGVPVSTQHGMANVPTKPVVIKRVTIR